MVIISSPFTGPSSTLRDAATLVQGLQKGLRADRVASATRPFSLTMSVNYANTAERVANTKKAEGDPGWQEFYARAMASGVARQVEASLFTDLDPAFQPATERQLGVVMATQWRATRSDGGLRRQRHWICGADRATGRTVAPGVIGDWNAPDVDDGADDGYVNMSG
jgi:hypothetical protein